MNIASYRNSRVFSRDFADWPDERVPGYFPVLDFMVEVAARLPNQWGDYIPYSKPMQVSAAWIAAGVLRRAALRREIEIKYLEAGDMKPLPAQVLDGARWARVLMNGRYKSKDIYVAEPPVDGWIYKFGTRLHSGEYVDVERPARVRGSNGISPLRLVISNAAGAHVSAASSGGSSSAAYAPPLRLVVSND